MTGDTIDPALFAGNRLLTTFPDELRAMIARDARLVDLAEGDVLFRRGQNVDRSMFPLTGTTVSLVVFLEDDRTIEAATVGNEGALGGIISCGHAPSFVEVRAITPGKALWVPMAALERAKNESAHLRNLFCRWSDTLLAQIMQSVACHALHPIEARAARWLAAMADRAHNRVVLTQEAFAALLGAQRTTINAVARSLQDDGLIAIRRGAVEVVDADGVRERACSCYRAVDRFYGEMIGDTGVGTPPA